MFACLHSLSAPLTLLERAAQDFTPRYEIIGASARQEPQGRPGRGGPLVMLDLAGLSRLFGSAREIGEQLRAAMGGAPVRIGIAASQTAAALLALGRAGLTVVSADEQPAMLAPLPVTVLGELETLRKGEPDAAPVARRGKRGDPPHIAAMEDVLPYFQSSLGRTSDAAAAPHTKAPLGPPYNGMPAPMGGGLSTSSTPPRATSRGGWMHPRDTHAAQRAKVVRRPLAPAKVSRMLKDIQALNDVLRRWGVKTLGALAALPPGEVYERLGARGVMWQRLARGADSGPLVPCVPEEPFAGALDLEWPIEGLEPLSFVLARLLEPLAERLEQADRGAAILHIHLRLTTREVHARTVQLPAPMRDPKTLRTLLLLDLESNPPSAAIDCVRVFIEPTPARVLQWTLYDRAQASPEQLSTLLARLTALMGDGHVGSPQLVDSWKPGAFEMKPFTLPSTLGTLGTPGIPGTPGTLGTALRRYRMPIPVRVQIHDGRPARLLVDRRGISGGAVTHTAGPWRTSGEWWNDADTASAWDRDEWDVVLDGGAAYRVFVERTVGQWFIEAVID